MNFSNFSNHFSGNSGILQLMNDLGTATGVDQDSCMLGGGNPAHIPKMESHYRFEMEYLLSSDGEFEKMLGNYDSPQGNLRFIAALAELLNENYGWPISAKNIAITNGSQASFGVLFNLFSGQFSDGAQKKILLPMAPEYIGYGDVGMGGGKIFMANRPVIQVEENDRLFYKYRVDFDELEIGADCGAICLSRPTNPTGNVVTDNELRKLSALAKQAGVPFILDGAYGHPFPGIIFSEAKPVWDEHIILCLSLSKLGLPGARTGIVVADPGVIEVITRSNAIFSLAPGRFGPALLTRLVENKTLVSLCQSEIRPYYKQRVDHTVEVIADCMSDLPVRIHRPEGAIFLWLWFENLPVSSESLYQSLKAQGVYIVSGHHFFPGLYDRWAHKYECIRVSYAANEAMVERGLYNITREVRAAYDCGSAGGKSLAGISG